LEISADKEIRRSELVMFRKYVIGEKCTSSVEILGSSCFLGCESLSSISFESNSQLKRIESEAFSGCSLSIVIPSTVIFIAYDAHPDLFRLSLSDSEQRATMDPDSYLMFDRWQLMRRLGIAVDFQRIRRFAPDLPHFDNFMLDLSGFEEKSVIGGNDRVSSQIYLRRIDGATTVVKAISLLGLIERRQIKTEIENLMNLRHLMIAPLIGFVFPVESSGRGEFKIVRLYATEGSLAKAVVGIVLGLRFAHGFGLLHGEVKASNILFDADRRIQITYFSPIRLETGEVEPFSSEGWAPTADVSSFASLLFEMVALSLRTLVQWAACLFPPLFQRLFRE
jgi:hypothetical protein